MHYSFVTGKSPYFGRWACWMAGFLFRECGRLTRHAARMAALPANPSLQSVLLFSRRPQNVLSGLGTWINRILGRKGSSSILPGLLLILTIQPALAAKSCPANPTYPVAEPFTQSYHNDIFPRLQWYANYGYCGETAFISAGLYYGQYISQYDARQIASSRVAQQSYKSQLLLGVNDGIAARRMHLAATTYETNNSVDFLTWVKTNVVGGYPVVIGVYENASIFGLGANEQYAQYDHIVPVMGIQSTHDLKDMNYYDDDRIILSDNGLFTPRPNRHPFYFSYGFKEFQNSRFGANHTDAVYSLTNKAGNYGIAFHGVTDLLHETVPVSLVTRANCELPAMKEGSNRRPAASTMDLTIRVSGLVADKQYVLYVYDNLKSVPDQHFSDPIHAQAALFSCVIPVNNQSTVFVTRQRIKSSQMAIYRAVQVTDRPPATVDCTAELPTRI